MPQYIRCDISALLLASIGTPIIVWIYDISALLLASIGTPIIVWIYFHSRSGPAIVIGHCFIQYLCVFRVFLREKLSNTSTPGIRDQRRFEQVRGHGAAKEPDRQDWDQRRGGGGSCILHHSAAGGGNDFRIFFPLQRFWSFLCLSQRYCIISYTNITITVTSLRHYLHKSIHTFCSQSVRYFFLSVVQSLYC